MVLATPTKNDSNDREGISNATPTKYSLKLPAYRSTGSAATDESQKAAHKLVQEMLDGLMKDYALALPMYNKYKDLKASKADQKDEAEYFTKLTTVGKVEDEAWVVEFLSRAPDLSSNELVQLKKLDDSAIGQLLEHMTQLAPTLKAKDELRCQEVLARFFRKRSQDQLNPLKNFKKEGGFRMQTGLNWKVRGSYTMEINEAGHIQKIKFRCGAVVDVSAEGLSDDYVVALNWSDWRAQLHKPPFPPLKLDLFFKTLGTGPYALGKPWSAASLEDEQEVGMIAQQYREERGRLQTTEVKQEVQMKLKEVTVAAKKECMQKARQQASANLKAKTAKSVINLKLKH